MQTVDGAETTHKEPKQTVRVLGALLVQKVHGVGTESHGTMSCGREESSAMAGLTPRREGRMPGIPEQSLMTT